MTKRGWKTLGITATAAASVAAALYGAAYFFFDVAFSRVRHSKILLQKKKEVKKPYDDYTILTKEGEAWLDAQNTERVTITSADGLKLTGVYLKAENPVASVLCVHGYRGSGGIDFGFFARFYHAHHCNVLVIDQRAHGKSEGEYITFGVMERQDVADWTKKLVELERAGVQDENADIPPIYLHGVSMGATSVLLASALDLPQEVHGLIADCGFTSPKEIMESVARQNFHMPMHMMLHILSILCRKKGRFDLDTVNTIDALKQNRIPVLFIHGSEDKFVPTIMTRVNYEVCVAPKRLLIVEGAAHVTSYLMDTLRYEKEVLDFIRSF